MQTSRRESVVSAARQVVAVRGRRGTTIEVESALILLTEAGVPDDRLLRAGDRYRVLGAGRIVIEGIEIARLGVICTSGWWAKIALPRWLAPRETIRV